ncbi:MAG TPA: ribosome biogenesis GTP-binding protein YihA/YsxC [Xanthomonadaceae bacterium]|jgi:GTP-binding protein|nr:ribosome biogenesis GTP-binding protein YihA/YsxC [Xanthomonadaceae bacterium]
MANPLARAAFIAAAHTLKQLPPDGGREVAFAGRSNAGKSSALNALCNQNALARTSKTPGRTQQLVYFEVEPQKYLVDLPGYGYAKVPLDLRAHWQEFINAYFLSRQALAGLVVVMDIRHPLREFDAQMLSYATNRGLPAHCLLTKADKLGRGQQSQTLAAVRRELPERVTAQVFSAEKKLGVDEGRGVVAEWLNL